MPELRGQASREGQGPRGSLPTSYQWLNAPSRCARRHHDCRRPPTQAPPGSNSPAEGFALAELFEHVPDATVELEPTVANPGDHALLVVETDASRRTVDAALRSSSSVAAIEGFGSQDHRSRYRVTWEGRPRRLIQQLTAEDVTLVGVHGKAGRWNLRMVAPERAALARAYETLEEFGCNPECLSLSTFEGGWSEGAGVSDKQRKALTKAFEMGYYDIPRTVTAEELAAEMNITHQALSERFRRAHQQLIEDTNIIP